jgi:hypothetical protein
MMMEVQDGVRNDGARSRAWLLLLAMLNALGCAREERLSPTVIEEIPDAGVDAPDADDGPIVRRVEERNPFGGNPENLLADGDFELSIASNSFGQQGFRALSSGFSQIVMSGETGGICRSGLRCARLKKGQFLYGQGTAAANEAPHDARIWFKPVSALEAGTMAPYECRDLATVQIFQCGTGTVLSTLKADAGPGSDGWCSFHGEPSGSRQALCMIVEMKEDALVDEATLVPAAEETRSLRSRVLPIVSAEDQARIDNVREAIRKTRRFGPPPEDHDRGL